MFDIIKKTWKGMGYMPIVGEHPGTALVSFFVLMSIFASITNQSIVPFLLIGLPVFVLYCIGAYQRAKYVESVGMKENGID